MSTAGNETHILPQVFKGLSGVVVDTTSISKVVPETNSLTYRGYAVQDLATQCSRTGCLPAVAWRDAQ